MQTSIQKVAHYINEVLQPKSQYQKSLILLYLSDTFNLT